MNDQIAEQVQPSPLGSAENPYPSAAVIPRYHDDTNFFLLNPGHLRDLVRAGVIDPEEAALAPWARTSPETLPQDIRARMIISGKERKNQFFLEDSQGLLSRINRNVDPETSPETQFDQQLQNLSTILYILTTQISSLETNNVLQALQAGPSEEKMDVLRQNIEQAKLQLGVLNEFVKLVNDWTSSWTPEMKRQAANFHSRGIPNQGTMNTAAIGAFPYVQLWQNLNQEVKKASQALRAALNFFGQDENHNS
jgi:hypothetical protein